MIAAHGTQTALDVLLESTRAPPPRSRERLWIFRNAGGPVRTRLTGRADLKQQLFEVVINLMFNQKVG